MRSVGNPNSANPMNFRELLAPENHQTINIFLLYLAYPLHSVRFQFVQLKAAISRLLFEFLFVSHYVEFSYSCSILDNLEDLPLKLDIHTSQGRFFE